MCLQLQLIFLDDGLFQSTDRQKVVINIFNVNSAFEILLVGNINWGQSIVELENYCRVSNGQT